MNMMSEKALLITSSRFGERVQSSASQCYGLGREQDAMSKDRVYLE